MSTVYRCHPNPLATNLWGGGETPVPAPPSLRDLTSVLSPVSAQQRLERALCHHLELEGSVVLLGAGSRSLITAVIKALVTPERVLLYPQSSFVSPWAAGVASVVIPSTLGLLQGKAVIEATKDVMARGGSGALLYLGNPDNPSAYALPRQTLERLLQSLPTGVFVLLDEAYAEYQEDPNASLGWLHSHPQLIITRSFSKAYGLAEPLGYAICHSDVAAYVAPYLSAPGTEVCERALAILGDTDFLQRSRSFNRQAYLALTAACDAMQLAYLPSFANFICIRALAEGSDLAFLLSSQGFAVTPLAGLGEQWREWLKVPLLDRASNQRLVDALRSYYQLHPEVWLKLFKPPLVVSQPSEERNNKRT